MENDEYFLVNVELEDRTNPRASREMCCLLDDKGGFRHDVEYKGDTKLNKAFDFWYKREITKNSMEGNHGIIVKINEGAIVSWRLSN